MSSLTLDGAGTLRLECLKLAIGAAHDSHEVMPLARVFEDYINGADRAALANEAKAAIDRAVR